MNLKIVYSEERLKNHQIFTDDVMKYGMHKACILGNIHLYRDCPKEKLYEYFPYMKKKEFYKLLDQMIDDNLISEDEE